MNYDRPALLERLASEYVLGTMSARARRRFARHLPSSFAAQRAVAQWQAHLLPLHQSNAPVAPAPGVWQAIARRTRPAEQTVDWRMQLRNWFGASMKPAVGLCFGIMLTLGLVQQAPQMMGLERTSPTLPASYVGVLVDAHDNAGLAVSSLRRGTIVSLKMIKPLAVPPGQVALLWALPAKGAPLRLGVVAAGGKSEIALAQPAEALFASVSKLAVSVEADPQASAPGSAYVLSGNCVKIW